MIAKGLRYNTFLTFIGFEECPGTFEYKEATSDEICTYYNYFAAGKITVS